MHPAELAELARQHRQDLNCSAKLARRSRSTVRDHWWKRRR